MYESLGLDLKINESIYCLKVWALQYNPRVVLSGKQQLDDRRCLDWECHLSRAVDKAKVALDKKKSLLPAFYCKKRNFNITFKSLEQGKL